jgi:hypothetical protein
MKIDIDKLSEEELIDLNNRIVARLRFLGQMRAHSQMLDFKIGDRVTFQPEGRVPLFGILTRYNKKTVTVITESGQHWNVAARVAAQGGVSWWRRRDRHEGHSAEKGMSRASGLISSLRVSKTP